MDTSSVSVPIGNGCGTLRVGRQLMPGCGPRLLTCTLPVMGQPALIGIGWARALRAGFIRISPLGAPGSFDRQLPLFLRPRAAFSLASSPMATATPLSIAACPTTSSLCGSRWILQAVVLAPSGARAFTASNALLITLGS